MKARLRAAFVLGVASRGAESTFRVARTDHTLSDPAERLPETSMSADAPGRDPLIHMFTGTPTSGTETLWG
jgi:hypothetical protein